MVPSNAVSAAGMIMAAKAFLDQNRTPREEIKKAVSGHCAAAPGCADH
jgi:aerobic-type carbon monoxide dehydrogenase small subunit (CoxS/CutS family)